MFVNAIIHCLEHGSKLIRVLLRFGMDEALVILTGDLFCFDLVWDTSKSNCGPVLLWNGLGH